MIRFFSLLLLITFLVISVTVLIVIVRAGTDDTHVQLAVEDTKTTTIISGRYVEAVISDKLERLYNTAYAGNDEWVLKSLNSYANYVASGAGHRGEFTVGFTGSGFKIEHSISSGSRICGDEYLVYEDVAVRVLSGRAFVGPISPKCIEEHPGAASLLMFAVPIFRQETFLGIVYEVSSILDFINSYNMADRFSSSVSARIVLDDRLKYSTLSENYRLLMLRNKAIGGVARDDGKLIGYYTFYVGDTKLCLIYIRNSVESVLSFHRFPWVERNKVFFFALPFILLFMLIILEMLHINITLGRDVEKRTKDIENIKHRYQKLFETIPEYVVLYKRDGEIIECNSRFSSLLNGGNPIGANLLYIIRDREKFSEMINRVEEIDSPVIEEYVISGGGEFIEATVHTCTVDLEGDKALLSVMTDLTDFKEMQNKYYLTQKREVVGTLAAGMVHDFSNILQNISLQYALMERAEGEAKDEHISKIRSILDGANSYLTGVLRYTKDDKGEYEIKSGSLFVRNAVDLLERIMPAEVKIEYVNKSGEIKIRASQSKISQILINLCQNAADAMGGAGVVNIETSVEEKAFGHFFCIKVKDSGEGIKPEVIDSIFKPFYTTKTDKGTGLGLATVKQAVLEMGGLIDVESTPGEGAEFILMFSEK